MQNPYSQHTLAGDDRRDIMKWAVYKEMYLEHLETRYDSDYPQQVRRVLDRMTRYCRLAERDLQRINDRDLSTYLRERKKDTWRGAPVGPRTLNNELDIINAAMRKAGPKEARGSGRFNWQFVEHIPPAIERVPEFQHDNVVVVTPEQLGAFIEAAKDATIPRWPACTPSRFWIAALLLDLVTGLRRRGLLLIPRPEDDVLLEKRQIKLPAEINKTRSDIWLSLGSDSVARYLASLPTKPGEPLLPWKDRRGRTMTLGHFSNTMAKIQRSAGISESQRIQTKHLRSTVGTEIADVFGDAIAKKKLGHSPKTNTLDTNYKSRRPRSRDEEASDHMASFVMPLIEDNDDGFRVVG